MIFNFKDQKLDFIPEFLVQNIDEKKTELTQITKISPHIINIDNRIRTTKAVILPKKRLSPLPLEEDFIPNQSFHVSERSSGHSYGSQGSDKKSRKSRNSIEFTRDDQNLGRSLKDKDIRDYQNKRVNTRLGIYIV